MAKLKLVKNHTYYSVDNGWKLKYIDSNLEGYDNFKVVEHDDPNEDWDEYSTRDPHEIVKTKKEADELRG